MTGNLLSTQPRHCEMDQGSCGERDRCGKRVDSRCRDSKYARAERYEKWLKCTIDHPKAWNNIWGDVECYRRQSERSCKVRRWGGCGRQRWRRRYRAWQAERRWRTWLGDGHNLQYGIASHAGLSTEADEVWWTDATGMGERGRLHL